MRAWPLVLVYLAAIALANVLVATYGPEVVVVNAFVLIALDLTLRDRLHDRWQRRQLWLRMLVLILAGGALSWALTPAAGQIALASAVAFVCAGAADALVYALLEQRRWLVRANGSNVAGAAADSLVFPMLAFGGLNLGLTLGLFVAKVAGGYLWSVALVVLGAIPQRRPAA